jgi:hypothetical protein
MSSNDNNRWGKGIWIFIAGFVLFILILVAFASFQTFHLVEKDYYRKEINYQERIDKIKRTATLNNGVIVSQDQTGRILNIQFDDDLDFENITGKIHFFRPSDARLDYFVPIQINDSGIQTIDLDGKEKGMWRVKIEWVIDDSGYYYEDIIVLE